MPTAEDIDLVLRAQAECAAAIAGLNREIVGAAQQARGVLTGLRGFAAQLERRSPRRGAAGDEAAAGEG